MTTPSPADTLREAAMTTPGLEAWLSKQEGRCSGCGYDLKRQGCCCTANATQHAVITAVTTSTPDAIKARIDAAIMRHARSGQPFSANHTRTELADIDGARIGPRYAALAKAGVISHVGYEPSTDPGTRHRLMTWIGANTQRSAA